MKGALPFILLILAAPAFAHHPGERLDEVMAEKERAFEPTDLRDMPRLGWSDGDGGRQALADFHEKIVILSFVPRDCGTPCAEQQAVLASVRKQVNITPMKQVVTFVTIRDPSVAVDATWDDANWRSGVPLEESARAKADRFSAVSDRDSALPIVHVIDRGGRHAGVFHGSDFRQTNLILYINGLTNAPHESGRSKADSWWGSVKAWFQ